MEFKFKISHVRGLVEVISKLHQKYETFSHEFTENMYKKLTSMSNGENDQRILKLLLKLYYDCIFAGITSNGDKNLKRINEFLAMIIRKDLCIYSPIIVYVAHSYSDEFGIHTLSQIQYFEFNNLKYQQQLMFDVKSRKSFIDIVSDCYSKLKIKVNEVNKELIKIRRKNDQAEGLYGELTQSQKEKQENLSVLFERIYNAVQSLSDIFHENFEFEAVLDEQDDDKIQILDLEPQFETKTFENMIWPDENTRSFYEDLQDYSSIISVVNQKQIENMKKMIKESLYSFKSDSKGHDDDEFDDDFDLNEFINKSKTKNPVMEVFMTKLQACVNRDLIDGCVDEFLRFLNSKPNRRSIIETFYHVPYSRCDLLPFYARFVATTAPYVPDIVIELSILLRRELFYHIRKFKQFNLESKIKTARFLGELVKFKIYSKAEGIHFAKALLRNWHDHSIDMLCSYLETCGLFLCQSPESRTLIEPIITALMQKKDSLVNEHHRFLISNALMACNPSEVKQRPPKLYTKFQKFVRTLIFTLLNRSNLQLISSYLCSLPLEDTSCTIFTAKILSSPWKLKYVNIPILASLVYLMRKSFYDLSIIIVDNVLEEIRLGLENNYPSHNQRRICTVKFLAELFNFQIIEAPTIYKTVYMIITFGQNINGVHNNDPPSCMIRILMICEILRTTSKYIVEEDSFKSFYPFFTLFQAYIWKKKVSEYYKDRKFPPYIEFTLSETFESLRLQHLLLKDSSEVSQAVLKITQHSLFNYNASNVLNKRTVSIINKIKNNTYSRNMKESTEAEESDNLTPTEIDEDLFESAYQKTILESFKEKTDSKKTDQLDLILPTNLNSIHAEVQDVMELQIEDKKCDNLKMLFLSRKNNKKCLKNLQIPKSDNLAINVMSKYHAKKDEKAEVKRYILNMNNERPSSPLKPSIVISSLPINQNKP